jgi:hypothetical protein
MISYESNKPDTRLTAEIESLNFQPDWVVFITFNARLNPFQSVSWQQLQTKLATVSNTTPYQILMSAGMPDETFNFREADLWLPICTYRPQVLQALPEFLKDSIAF